MSRSEAADVTDDLTDAPPRFPADHRGPPRRRREREPRDVAPGRRTLSEKRRYGAMSVITSTSSFCGDILSRPISTVLRLFRVLASLHLSQSSAVHRQPPRRDRLNFHRPLVRLLSSPPLGFTKRSSGAFRAQPSWPRGRTTASGFERRASFTVGSSGFGVVSNSHRERPTSGHSTRTWQESLDVTECGTSTWPAPPTSVSE
jgi:hypothetical protein